MSAGQFNIDYHQLLGVNRNADEKTILKAFRQLSRKYHPDKVSGQEDKMKLLTMAKVTLLDPEKRAKYEANYETNYEYGYTDPNLTADLLKLNIGHRLSDDYRTKITQWKQEYQSVHIILNMQMLDEFIEELEKSIFAKRTILDLGVNQLINQNKSDQMMFEELQALFVAQDFGNLGQYILTHQCRSVLAKLYEDVKPTHGYELPDNLKALLQIIKVCSTLYADSHQNRIRGLYETVFIYPLAECIDCVLKLINNRMSDAHKTEVMNKVLNHDILEERAENKKYMNRLECNPTLRSVIKYEHGIHVQNIEPMEKAMLYIDLCMVYGHPIMLANNMIMASIELIAHMAQSKDTAEVYALKNCVIELCATVLHFVSTYIDPISQLKFSIHVIRVIKRANQILADSVEENTSFLENFEKPLIGDIDRCLLELANHCVLKSIRVSPLVDTTFDMTSDMLYINLINNRLLEKYYQWNIDTYSDHPSAHLYQYSLMEGSWKGWFDETKFDEYRRKCIKVLLGKTMMSELDVARTMKAEIELLIPKSNPGNRSRGVLKRLLTCCFSPTDCTSAVNFRGGYAFESKPLINRCEKGWIMPDQNYLNMGNASFNSVDGLIIDVKKGTFEIIVSTDEQLTLLCDGQDIDEIVMKGLSHSVFSLDQADFELDYHPFQLMRFSPKSLENSRYLSTVLAADYLLKMIATNTEVSAEAPFEIKQAVDGFLKALPSDLREFIMMKKSTTDFGKVHRFWIENGEIPCYKNVDDDVKLTYEFYYTPMLVKKHLMKKNSQGELVDDFDDSEDELSDDSENGSDEELIPPRKKISPEARFTRRLSQFYDLIGCYFPVLLRLRELAKLSAISMILKNTYHSLEASKKQTTVSRNEVRCSLESIRSQITYPICTESKVNELYRETLRKNGLYDDSRVAYSEVQRVKNEIRSSLNNAERKMFIDLPKYLSESMEFTNTQELHQLVINWIKHGQYDALVDHLSTAIYKKRIEQLSRFGNNLKKLGVDLDTDGDAKLNESDIGCKWVPAAFSQHNGKRAYGGVFLRPTLSSQNVKGFQGFQSSAKNASFSAASSNSGVSGSFKGGSSGSSGGGSSGNYRGVPPPPKPPKNREEVMAKYGHGKSWPETPIRVSDTYFGRPNTAHKTHQGIIIKFGPSGWPQVHNPRYNTQKAAIEAAARANRGHGNSKVIVDGAHGKNRMKQGTASDQQKGDYLNKNKKGDHSNHVHSTDKKGDKLKDGVHHLFK